MVRIKFYTYPFRETFFSLTVIGGTGPNLISIAKGIVFSTRATFFSGVGDADSFTFPDEVPDEDGSGAADKVEAVSEMRGGTFATDSAVSSDEELLPPPKNSLSLPTKKVKTRQRSRKRTRITHQ
jgi:hypothetical protein